MTKMEQSLLLFQPAITWLVVTCIKIDIECKMGLDLLCIWSDRIIPNVANTYMIYCNGNIRTR